MYFQGYQESVINKRQFPDFIIPDEPSNIVWLRLNKDIKVEMYFQGYQESVINKRQFPDFIIPDEPSNIVWLSFF